MRGLGLSDFCDLVWLELWDDCPAMGDQVKYREMLMAIFYEGADEAAIDRIAKRDSSRDAKSPPDLSRPLPTEAVDAMRKMRDRFQASEPADE